MEFSNKIDFLIAPLHIHAESSVQRTQKETHSKFEIKKMKDFFFQVEVDVLETFN